MQLDLFGAAHAGPLFAQAARASFSPSTASPNDHGIYPEDEAELLVLPCLRKNWKGCPTAEIALLHHVDGWLASYGYQLLDGDCRGGACGLSPKWHGGFLPDRRAALDHAVAQLHRVVKGCEGKDAQRVRDWLAVLL